MTDLKRLVNVSRYFNPCFISPQLLLLRWSPWFSPDCVSGPSGLYLPQHRPARAPARPRLQPRAVPLRQRPAHPSPVGEHPVWWESEFEHELTLVRVWGVTESQYGVWIYSLDTKDGWLHHNPDNVNVEKISPALACPETHLKTNIVCPDNQTSLSRDGPTIKHSRQVFNSHCQFTNITPNYIVLSLFFLFFSEAWLINTVKITNLKQNRSLPHTSQHLLCEELIPVHIITSVIMLLHLLTTAVY